MVGASCPVPCGMVGLGVGAGVLRSRTVPPRPRTLEGASVTGTGRRVAAPGVRTAWAGGKWV